MTNTLVEIREVIRLSNDGEAAARNLNQCPGCGGEKQRGCVVCWPCFKHRTDVTPLKYFDGSLLEWIDMLNGVVRE